MSCSVTVDPARENNKPVIWGLQGDHKEASYRCFFLCLCPDITWSLFPGDLGPELHPPIVSLQISSGQERQHASSCFSLLKFDKGQCYPLCYLLSFPTTFIPQMFYPIFFNRVILFFFFKSSLLSLKTEHRLGVK